MAQQFRNDPAQPGARLWRQSNGPVVLAWFLLLFFLLPVGVFVWAIAVSAGRGETGLAAVLAAMLVVILLLMVLIARSMRGQSGGWIRLERDGARFHLSANRSLSHRPPAFARFVRYPDIAAVTARDEAYGAAVNRVYWLEERGVPATLLFEERGIGSRGQQPSMATVAAQLAQAAGLPVSQKAMARGQAVAFGLWGMQGPGFDAAPMTAGEQARTWRWVGRMGWLVLASLALVAAVRLLTAAIG